MRIKHRFGFHNSESDVSNFLYNHGIIAKRQESVTILEIFEDDKNFKIVNDMFDSHRILSIPEAVFSTSELDDTEWLSVRSTWRAGYPLPKDDMNFRFSTYDASSYCEKCGAGLIQRECFKLPKEPNWGSRNFLMLNWIHDELFISEKAVTVLRNGEYSGFSFKDVLDKSGNSMQGIKQLYVVNNLNYGLCSESISKKMSCHRCGRVRYLLNTGFINYSRITFENVQSDIIKSAEHFGEITCCHMLFVTKRLYKHIVQARLSRGLLFEPVRLV